MRAFSFPAWPRECLDRLLTFGCRDLERARRSTFSPTGADPTARSAGATPYVNTSLADVGGVASADVVRLVEFADSKATGLVNERLSRSCGSG